MIKLKNSFLVFCLLISCVSLKSQNHWFQNFPDSTTQIEIRYSRPDFSNFFTDLNILAGIYEVRLNTPIFKLYNIHLTVPFINSDFEEFEAERGIANASIGIQRTLKNNDKEASSLMLDVFIPTARNEAEYLEFGLFTDFHNFPKYLPDALSFQLNYAHIYHIYKGFSMEGEFAPVIVLDVGEQIDESELLLRFGLAAMYDFKSFNLRAEFNGEAILTESSVADKLYQSFSVGAQLTQGQFQPGIFYNISLDDNFSNSTDGILGLLFAFEF